MLLMAITVSLAGVWQGLKQVLVAGADRLCESCGKQGDAALAIMEGILLRQTAPIMLWLPT